MYQMKKKNSSEYPKRGLLKNVTNNDLSVCFLITDLSLSFTFVQNCNWTQKNQTETHTLYKPNLLQLTN